MAKKIKDYQIYKCPYCSCEYYDSSARDGRKTGNPMVVCPSCKKESYRASISEPALIGPDRFFNIRYSSLYGNLRIGMIIIYAVFLFFILITKDFTMAISFILAAVMLFLLYSLVRVFHKKSFCNSPYYESEIAKSMKRLEDDSYAMMVINAQGMEEDSVYYYYLQQRNKTGEE